MKTWLDYFVIDQNVRCTIQRDYKVAKLPPSPLRTTIASLGLSFLAHIEGYRQTQGKSDASAISTLYIHALLSILYPIHHQPLCLAATKDLAVALARKETVDCSDVIQNALDKHRALYIDLPHNMFVFGDSELRAIIAYQSEYVSLPTHYSNSEVFFEAHPDRRTNFGIQFNAICTKANTDSVTSHICWFSDSRHTAQGVITYDIDLDLLQKQVEELVKLLILYYELAPASTRSSISRIDPVSLTERSHRRVFEKEKTFSLFDIVELRLTENQNIFYISPTTHSRSGWKLGHKIDVEGYYQGKWKGPKGNQYCELIYVPAHTRGPDIEQPKMPLYKMDL